MADVMGMAFAVVFIAVLLIVGTVVFAYVADLTGDPFHTNEILIAAGCSDDNASTEGTLCTGTANYLPIENITRAVPVLTNCTTARTSCQTLTAGTHYNYSKSSGLFWLASGFNTSVGDTYNGTIFINYYEDDWKDTVDNAQQSITGITYSGFDLGMIMAIVMAAVGVVAGIFLIGRRGA